MFWENTFEVPREMSESIISVACEHNPRTPTCLTLSLEIKKLWAELK